MIMGEEKGVKPALLKFGLALALSFAGFIYSRLNTRRIKPSSPKGSPSGEVSSGEGIEGILSTSNNLSQDDKCTNRVISDKSPVGIGIGIGISPKSKPNGKKDEFLLPEFNDLLKEVDFGEDVEAPRPKVGSSIAYASSEKDEYEREIRQLENRVRMLQDREQSLEVQLLEYCGLKEQQTVVMELQNRLKITNMEAKMFSLKVKILQSENRKLEEWVADHAKVLAELEATKAKVKMLKRKIRYEAERNREQLAALQQKVAKLREQECADAACCDQDIQLKLQKLKELESEAEELRRSNLSLQMENSDLARRLDSTQILANSVLEHSKENALKEESERLRQENENLKKEIEQLQADRCSDVEELVYVRWINACLRYELRNYQAPPGKTVARDLSRSLSPTSEKKAKQLILEYANADDGTRSIVDFDLDQWSSSQGSILSDSEGECDDFSSVDNSSAAKTNTTSKSKIFSKLRRMIRGKDGHHRRQSQVSLQEKSVSQEDIHSPPHFWLSTSTGNDIGAEGLWREFVTPTAAFRTSFDSSTGTKVGNRRNSDSIVVGNSYEFSQKKRGSFSGSLRSIEESDLKKYAEALKDSSVSAKQHRRRRSASYS
ncbi:hypothetical protein RIF29_28078 [Crotalaria pallida]|uniref:Protein CHUP1, chloroplastic n=1 Tax=Crotalaria pallida TaxID=3830 RepID=A0AAN9I1M1_CROPI